MQINFPPPTILTRLISVLFLCVVFVQFGCAANAQQPAPTPGPAAISPRSWPRTPPLLSPSPEKPVEVPIGRLPEYEGEKRKAGEITGNPPGAIQEDPASRQPPDKSSSATEK